MTSLLYNVSATDPVTFGAVGALLVVVRARSMLDPRTARDAGGPGDCAALRVTVLEDREIRHTWL